MQVLVVDDDAAARFVAKRWLTTTLGCRVVDCQDGVRALELLAAKHFDLALIDLDLPGVSGLEIIDAIRSSETIATLPVIVLSQERREDVVKTLAGLGISAYLLKPLRERAVVDKIGPILAALPSRTPSVDGRLGVLSKDEPALLVDGDQNFRHLFGQVAEPYGPVISAGSGAEGLAKFRRAPVGLVFVGQSLGILGAAALLRRIREVALTNVRFIGLGATTPASGELPTFDAVMPRVFTVDELNSLLQPFVRVSGPLENLEELAPDFRPCLTSAVAQVFGAMGGLTAEVQSDVPPEVAPGIAADVSVDVDGRCFLDLELFVVETLANDVSLHSLGCDPADVNDEARRSTSGELANMVTGRLDAWFKARGFACRFSSPVVRTSTEPHAPPAIPPSDGFVCAFTVKDVAAQCLVSVRARLPGVATAAA